MRGRGKLPALYGAALKTDAEADAETAVAGVAPRDEAGGSGGPKRGAEAMMAPELTRTLLMGALAVADGGALKYRASTGA
jgi:hypothetical protein